MIPLTERIDLLDKLGQYMLANTEDWEQAKRIAETKNAWFDAENINLAVQHIAEQFLNKEALSAWAAKYQQANNPKKVGIVTAGNIPLVGFHDFLCGFVSGHITCLKLSSKDDALLKHLINKLTEWNLQVAEYVIVSEQLKGCDAYIATGSNNTARYFEQYFGKYPNIIRKNRTSVAVLDGNETEEDFTNIGTDIFSYYGLGCRNVTKVYLPQNYNTETLLEGLLPFKHVFEHHKYKNNFDYHLAIYLLNKVPYKTNDFLLMVENEVPFSPVGSLHYEFYDNKEALISKLHKDDSIQCVIDNSNIKYGQSQIPMLDDYADGVDTMMFLSQL